MKKINILLGTGILSILLMSFTGASKNADLNHDDDPTKCATERNELFAAILCKDEAARNLRPEEIILIEQEEEIELNFDTTAYLPLDFNPYKGWKIDVNDIVVEEFEEEINLGFEVNDYLPKGFDPYAK
ncbi:MAG TPA: hypothetical protein VLZ54_06165 [Arenibacter sp.]|nr:hypothetical protein [Arenibacter sp.]